MSNRIAKSEGNIYENKYPLKSMTLHNGRMKIALD